MYLSKLNYLFLILFSFSILVACGGGDDTNKPEKTEKKKKKKKSLLKKKSDPMKDVGIGPVKELILSGEVDQAMADKGKAVYKEKCTACHKVSKKFVGPSPKGVLDRRNPAWVMNMILNPEEMVQKNPIAKKLLQEFNGSPMANQNLTEEEARSVVEYFRTL